MASAYLGAATIVGQFGVLGTRLVDDVAAWAELANSVAQHTRGMTAAELDAIHELLYPDLFSEYDARFLSRELHRLDLGFSDQFLDCERVWAFDEELHYQGFRTAYGAAFRRTAGELDLEMGARRSAVDFAPIADLFEDEFSVACLLAYDELATVRAYRANRENYARLGPAMSAFVDLVTGDEGRHYRNFFKLIAEGHAHRMADFDRVIQRILECEGVAYGNTFVLDHDGDVWNDGIFEESAAVLRRHLHA